MNEHPEIPTWMMTLIALGFFGGLTAFAFWLKERRRVGFEALAKRLGLEYYEDGAHAVPLPPEFIAEITRGFVVDARAGEALAGEIDGVPIAVCELRRLRASSGGSERAHYSACMTWAQLPDPLPDFSITPRTRWRRLPGPRDAVEIEFDGPAAFTRRYAVSGPDPGAIRALFTAPVREFLANHPGRHIRCYGSEIIGYRPPRMLRWSAFRPATAEQMLHEWTAFLQRLREAGTP